MNTLQQRRKMVTERIIRLSLLACIVFSFSTIVTVLSPDSSAAVTSVPAKINFQGRLTNSSGNTLTDGVYNMRLKLYSTASAGTALWSEDRLVSASTGVTVSNGLFSIRLGDVTTLPVTLFNNQTYGTLYLEIELATPATATSSSPSWTEGAMTPRNQLATSAYAFNSDTLDGLDSAAFVQIGGTNTFTGANTFKPTTDSTTSFSIQDSSGSNLLVADTTNDRLYIGNPTADANVTFLAVDTYNQGSDPPGGFPGAMYYNSIAQKFRCYESTYWLNCIPEIQVANSLTTLPGPSVTTAAKASAATVLVSPLYVPGQITVNQIRLRVFTALGATGDVGIYDADGNRVLNGGSGSLSTAVGVKTIVPTQTGGARLLFPGQYFVAITWNSTTGVVAGANLAGNTLRYSGTISSGGGSVLPSILNFTSVVDSTYLYGVSIND